MDISNASTEPFCRFHSFHEEFNRSTKVAFGALQALMRSDKPLTILETGDEPWGPYTEWRDPIREARAGIKFLSAMGIVRVMSAFEDFLVTVDAEYSRTAFLRAAAASQPNVEDTDEDEPLLKNVCGRLGWSTDPVAFAMPLYDLFSVTRNCIVHRSGRASKALVQVAESPPLASSHAAWPRRKGTRIPKLPAITVGKEIRLFPRHAILASSVCYEIARYLNGKLVDTIGGTGLVYMAAYHSLLSDDKIEIFAKKSPEVIIRHVLADRYRLKEVGIAETVDSLKTMGKWQLCRLAYRDFEPKGTQLQTQSKC